MKKRGTLEIWDSTFCLLIVPTASGLISIDVQISELSLIGKMRFDF